LELGGRGRASPVVELSVECRGNPLRIELGRFTLNPKLARFVKEVQFNSRFRKYFFPRFAYNFTAPQLCFLCQCIEDTRHVQGAIAEIGCANGSTTVFLNKYMEAQNIPKHYYALDTFSGFVPADIEVEVVDRGKTADLYTGFVVNKKKWFDGTMQQNNIARVRSIETDVNKYDLTTLGPLSFALLDVDLYRPMKKALPELYQVLNPNGIIVVDDCDSKNTRWDGSEQAYKEFMIAIGRSPQIIHRKLGILKKDA
jgi:O-methyltransferase